MLDQLAHRRQLAVKLRNRLTVQANRSGNTTHENTPVIRQQNRSGASANLTGRKLAGGMSREAGQVKPGLAE